jgi:hypothetical protein
MLIEDLMQVHGADPAGSDDTAPVAANGTDPGGRASVQSRGLSPDAKSPVAIAPPLDSGEEGGSSGPMPKVLTAKARQAGAANVLLAAAQALLIFSLSREEWAGISAHINRSHYQPCQPVCPLCK